MNHWLVVRCDCVRESHSTQVGVQAKKQWMINEAHRVCIVLYVECVWY